MKTTKAPLLEPLSQLGSCSSYRSDHWFCCYLHFLHLLNFTFILFLLSCSFFFQKKAVTWDCNIYHRCLLLKFVPCTMVLAYLLHLAVMWYFCTAGTWILPGVEDHSLNCSYFNVCDVVNCASVLVCIHLSLLLVVCGCVSPLLVHPQF